MFSVLATETDLFLFGFYFIHLAKNDSLTLETSLFPPLSKHFDASGGRKVILMCILPVIYRGFLYLGSLCLPEGEAVAQNG